MPRYTVHVPETAGFRRQTAAEWLAEFMIHAKGEQSQVFTLPAAVTIKWVDSGDREAGRKRCRTSLDLFGTILRLAAGRATLTAVSWSGGKIGAGGLFTLNHAMRTPRGHARGINIVRAFMEDRKGPKTPLRSDWPALLSYLEIRPILTPARVKAPRTLSIMSPFGLS